MFMETIYFRLINNEDAENLSQYYSSNSAHFAPWSPAQPYDFHCLAQWKLRLPKQLEAQQQGVSYTFVAVNRSTNAIVAHCTLSQIFYGPFRACYMGYGIDQHYQGLGLMASLCGRTIEFAFKELKLHRIMANYMPHNNRSARLLKKLGFSWEGRAKQYLEINGRWEDHMLTSLTNPDPL